MTNKVLVQFHWNCGRSGDVDGVFISTAEELESHYGKQVYFGEILGKHSEVFGTLDKGDITILVTDQHVITVLEEACGDTISGYNPLEYLQKEDDDE